MLKKFELPLQQLSRRYKEREQLLLKNCNENASMSHLRKHTSGPISSQFFGLEIEQYLRFFNNRFKFIVDKNKNCFCELMNSKIICIKNIILHKGITYFIGVKLEVLDINLYTLPCNSKDMGINLISDLDHSSELNTFKLLDIKCKLWLIPYGNYFVSFPIIHTII